MAGVHLGIDYGTSNTVAVLRRDDGRGRALMFDGTPLLPSAVFAGDGRVLVGRDAERAARTDPARFEANPKRRIDDLEVLLGDHVYGVARLIAAGLDRVVAEARRVAGAPLGAVTMTHPVAWGPARRKVLVEAARQVGLAEPVLVPEPVAAAAYFTGVLGNEVGVGQSLVVYDLGAGTFDVSVVQRTADGYETLAYRGLDTVGGLDLDALVVRHVGERLQVSAPEAWRRLTAPGSAQDRRHRLQLWQDAREAREALTREASATLFVAAAEQDVMVTRQEFERAATGVLQQTVDTTLATVREARVRPDDLAGWFLVGGATRTPLVATLLLRATGRPATVLEEPQLVVADGAVHVTAGWVDAAVSRPLPEPVTPPPGGPLSSSYPAAAPVSAPGSAFPPFAAAFPAAAPLQVSAPPVAPVSPSPVAPRPPTPHQSPVPQQPAQSPVPQQPMQSPVPQQPMQSPVPQQPMQSPAPPMSLQSSAPRQPQQSPVPRQPMSHGQGPTTVTPPPMVRAAPQTQPGVPPMVQVVRPDEHPAGARRRWRNRPLGRSPREIVALVCAFAGMVETFYAVPLLGLPLLGVLVYRFYRLGGRGATWADVVSAVTFLAVPGLAGLASRNIVVLAVGVAGLVAGLLWIRRFVDDRAP